MGEDIKLIFNKYIMKKKTLKNKFVFEIGQKYKISYYKLYVMNIMALLYHSICRWSVWE